MTKQELLDMLKAFHPPAELILESDRIVCFKMPVGAQHPTQRDVILRELLHAVETQGWVLTISKLPTEGCAVVAVLTEEVPA